MKEHQIDISRDSFQAISEGNKKHIVWKDDGTAEVGKYLELREWNETKGKYTGRWIRIKITFVSPGGHKGLPNGVCVFSFVRIESGSDK